jgi:DNA-directed RNA polymerase specialized sigma24 family protein
VFVLYELEGLTMAEVAETLELPESTALSRLYAAREEIQRFIQKMQAAAQRRAYAKRSGR